MQNAAAMGFTQSRTKLTRNFKSDRRRYRAFAFHPRPQRLALQQFHRQKIEFTLIGCRCMDLIHLQIFG
jgi:hypothetical protein